MKVRPMDPTVTLEIALDGRSVPASRAEPGEVPDDIGARLVKSPAWEEVGEAEPTIEEILSDVGSNKDKAAAALADEQAKGDGARKTLVRKLEAVIGEEA
jgi:hypothetical protein